jgi:hypothetical protein
MLVSFANVEGYIIVFSLEGLPIDHNTLLCERLRVGSTLVLTFIIGRLPFAQHVTFTIGC